MRRLPNSPASFAAAIRRDEKNVLDNLLPMQGGRKWAVEVALEEFLSLCENNKTLQSWVHDQILSAKLEDPPRGADVIQPKISPSLYERFNSLFGEKGGTTWFLRNFVTSYINVMDKRTLPEDQVREAVRKMLRVGE